VFLRVRPTGCEQTCNLYKFDVDHSKVIVPQTNGLSTNTTEKHYSFSSIMSEEVDQVAIYDEIVRPIMNHPFEIRGATFAGYGVSNSGKTYTILGESSAGLVPRAITQIFTEYSSQISEFPCVRILNDKVDIMNDDQVIQEMDVVEEFLNESKKQFKGKARPWKYENIVSEHNFQVQESAQAFNRIFIWVSLIEIYNEKVTDLLTIQKGTQRPLKIFSNAGNSYVHGATWLYVKDIKQAFEILNQGLNRVSYAATGINTRSSRSHTIFTINVVAEITIGVEFQLSSFKFCDLAGAERLKKTGNVGVQLKEAGGINGSLLVLGRCLESVFQNQSKVNKRQPDAVIPVRDSKLTLLIQSSLVGHEKFVMIVNLLPTAEFFDENINVLKFGSIANQIVVKKSELRKFKRQSTRYSFFNNEIADPMKNSSLNASHHSFYNESELDDSFNWNSMTPDELRHVLQLQRVEIGVLKNAVEEKEREALLNERRFRNDIIAVQEQVRDKLKMRNEESENLLKQYHEKKVRKKYYFIVAFINFN
jgi:kinesin family protein 20